MTDLPHPVVIFLCGMVAMQLLHILVDVVKGPRGPRE
jgi:hypothetical protein